MAINVITNLKVILLILALCALLFLSNTQATSELYNKCEKEFWFKNLKDFKKSIKSECIKENHHHEKRHRQYHICNNKSYDNSIIRSKWEKFSDCRCEAALLEMSNFKKSNVFVCYQIASLNKATGEFLGELSVYKKKSKDNYDVTVKFSHNVKVMNGDGQYEGVVYRTEKVPQDSSDIGRFLNEKYYISGKISKSESMNKVSIDNISPREFKITVNDGESCTLKKNHEFAIIPFSKFVPSENFLKKEHKQNKEKPSDDGPKDPPPENSSPENSPPENSSPENSPPENSSPENSPPENSSPENSPPENSSPENSPPENSPPENSPPENSPPENSSPENSPPENSPPENSPPENSPPENSPPENGPPENGPPDPSKSNPSENSPPENNPPNDPNGSTNGPSYPSEPSDPNEPSDSNGPSYPNEPSDSNEPSYPNEPSGSNGPSDSNEPDSTDPTDTTDTTDDSATATVANLQTTEAKQEAANNENTTSSGGVSPAAVGSIVFGVIIGIGAIFIGCNTYERLRWRRQYRRRQAAAQQNSSLANVPDYNGYGRAY